MQDMRRPLLLLELVTATREYTSTQQDKFNSESKGFYDLVKTQTSSLREIVRFLGIVSGMIERV